MLYRELTKPFDYVLPPRVLDRRREASGRQFFPAPAVLPYDTDCSFDIDSFKHYGILVRLTFVGICKFILRSTGNSRQASRWYSHDCQELTCNSILIL